MASELDATAFQERVYEELLELEPALKKQIHVGQMETLENMLLAQLQRFTYEPMWQKFLKLRPKPDEHHWKELAERLLQVRMSAELRALTELLHGIWRHPELLQELLGQQALQEWKERAEHQSLYELLAQLTQEERMVLARRLGSDLQRRPYSLGRLGTLQSEQLKWLELVLWEFELMEHEQWLKELTEMEPDNQEWIRGQEKLTERREASIGEHNQLRQRRKVISEQKARELIARKDILDYLCPALQTTSDDAFEIVKVITPILVGLVMAGTLSVPLIPVLFASIGLVVARMGIASLCADYDKNEKDKK